MGKARCTSLHWCTSPSGSVRHTGHSMNERCGMVRRDDNNGGAASEHSTQNSEPAATRTSKGTSEKKEGLLLQYTVAGGLPLLPTTLDTGRERTSGQLVLRRMITLDSSYVPSALYTVHVVPELLPEVAHLLGHSLASSAASPAMLSTTRRLPALRLLIRPCAASVPSRCPAAAAAAAAAASAAHTAVPRARPMHLAAWRPPSRRGPGLRPARPPAAAPRTHTRVLDAVPRVNVRT